MLKRIKEISYIVFPEVKKVYCTLAARNRWR